MSQAPTGQPLGSAKIDFVGDTTGVRAAAAETVAVTKDAANQAQTAAQTSASTTEEAVTGWKKLRSTVGLAASALAVADAALRGVAAQREEIERLADAFRAVNDAGGLRGLVDGGGDALSRALSDANTRLDALQKQVGDEAANQMFSLQGIADRLMEEIYGVQGANVSAIQQQIAQTREGIVNTVEQIRASREADALAAARDLQASEQRKAVAGELYEIQKDANAAASEGVELTKEQEVTAELERRLSTLAELRDKAIGTSMDNAGFQREMQRLEEAFKDAASRGLNAAIAESARSLRDALNDVRQQAANLFPTSQITGQLSQIVQAVQDSARALHRIQGQ